VHPLLLCFCSQWSLLSLRLCQPPPLRIADLSSSRSIFAGATSDAERLTALAAGTANATLVTTCSNGLQVHPSLLSKQLTPTFRTPSRGCMLTSCCAYWPYSDLDSIFLELAHPSVRHLELRDSNVQPSDERLRVLLHSPRLPKLERID